MNKTENNIILTLSADLELWCKYSKIYNYADDTTSSCSGKNLDDIINNLKHDAEAILRYIDRVRFNHQT